VPHGNQRATAEAEAPFVKLVERSVMTLTTAVCTTRSRTVWYPKGALIAARLGSAQRPKPLLRAIRPRFSTPHEVAGIRPRRSGGKSSGGFARSLPLPPFLRSPCGRRERFSSRYTLSIKASISHLATPTQKCGSHTISPHDTIRPQSEISEFIIGFSSLRSPATASLCRRRGVREKRHCYRE